MSERLSPFTSKIATLDPCRPYLGHTRNVGHDFIDDASPLHLAQAGAQAPDHSRQNRRPGLGEK
jgi:hypothetical protein